MTAKWSITKVSFDELSSNRFGIILVKKRPNGEIHESGPRIDFLPDRPSRKFQSLADSDQECWFKTELISDSLLSVDPYFESNKGERNR